MCFRIVFLLQAGYLSAGRFSAIATDLIALKMSFGFDSRQLGRECQLFKHAWSPICCYVLRWLAVGAREHAEVTALPMEAMACSRVEAYSDSESALAWVRRIVLVKLRPVFAVGVYGTDLALLGI